MAFRHRFIIGTDFDELADIELLTESRRRWSARELRSAVDGPGNGWIAMTHDYAIAGFVTYRYRTDDLIEITRLIVHPDHRGKGVGRSLVNLVRERCVMSRSIRGVVVRIRESEWELARYFQRCGGKVKHRFGMFEDEDGWEFRFSSLPDRPCFVM